MAHLLGVASLVMGEAGQVPFAVTEDMVIAALLHDAAEDHGGQTRIDDISCNFGPQVARTVEGLSDTFVEDPSQNEDWDYRKTAYLARVPDESPETQLISAADKLYNARTILDEYRAIGPNVLDRFHCSRDQQLWYFKSMLKVFKSAGTNRTVEELDRVIAELEKISSERAPR
jgi:(p)ppGpp synthase/HD superfamily hydrolase